MIQIEMTFDAGHRIVGHKGKCARLHGHTYRARIECGRGTLRDPGFVVDFGDVKDLVNEWDHRMLLWQEDPLTFSLGVPPDLDITVEQWWRLREDEEGIVRLPFNPTAENMSMDLSQRICLAFDLDWCKVRLWETPNAWAEAMFYLRGELGASEKV
jgi:6-pyruvoyl-tetrahydropterin synthase